MPLHIATIFNPELEQFEVTPMPVSSNCSPANCGAAQFHQQWLCAGDQLSNFLIVKVIFSL